MKFNIRKWSPKTMLKPHRKVLYIGASGKGKSVAMRAVLRAMPPVDLAIGFTPTDDTAAELARILPPRCIHDSTSSASSPTRSARCADRGRLRFRLGRVALQIALQHCLSLDPSLRTNVDYVICTACGNHQEKRKLYQSFFGVFKTYSSFDQCFTQCTSDWRCIVLDQTQPSPNIENSVFWFKADLEAEKVPFRLCKSVFWQFAANPPRQKKTADVLVVEDSAKPVDKRSIVVVG